MNKPKIKKVLNRKIYFGSKKRTALTFLIAIPVLVGAASLSYQYYLFLNPAVVYSHRLQKMTDTVSKTVKLPADETPIVATVTDQNILPKQRFFSYAKNGDKILMYKKHKLAILYRPSLGVVVTEATLDFKNTSPTASVQKGLPAGRQVAGAATSRSSTQVTLAPSTALSPTVAPAKVQSSGSTAYHPQGKILVVPQQ